MASLKLKLLPDRVRIVPPVKLPRAQRKKLDQLRKDWLAKTLDLLVPADGEQ